MRLKVFLPHRNPFLPLFTWVSSPPGLCAHGCPHQGICMLFPKEDFPLQIWDKSSALVLLWLTRTPQFTLLNMRFPAQLRGLLLLWVPGEDGGGWEGGCREWGALGQHFFSCVFVSMFDAHFALCKGHVIFSNMRMIINTQEISRCSLLNTVRYNVWASVHDS